ncbi:uncharacterized protein EV422DRAFT_23830 [Fimicolochytrium jonesii]|uniref:uncharacterized protein n=1 Tax=Fimicolochytrium jonesii TaxID=1396493 RepID=UPI0022FE4F53|nr:uncharacterized protein EV422DRAFT_23830 [Fimicolochytrium jonesii]KAI8827063.1 hypothetical protein EV422DRAFT_23830 [Fimicolochytrium jonesii]
MVSPKFKLTYFNVRGRGEVIRLALTVAGFEFEDDRLTEEAFAARKYDMPFNQLPVLEITENDGQVKRLAQQHAILRYIGRIGGLYPEDPFVAAKVDEVLGACEDVSLIMKPNMSEPDAEKRVNMREEMIKPEGELTVFLRKFDAVVAASGTEAYTVGDKLTIADLMLYVQASWLSVGVLRGIPKTYYEQFTYLNKVKENVDKLPDVAKWNKHAAELGAKLHAAALAAKAAAQATATA